MVGNSGIMPLQIELSKLSRQRPPSPWWLSSLVEQFFLSCVPQNPDSTQRDLHTVCSVLAHPENVNEGIDIDNDVLVTLNEVITTIPPSTPPRDLAASVCNALYSPSTIIQIEEPECELVPHCADLDLESTFTLNDGKRVEVILNPSDLEVKDFFTEQATSAKFDFVRLACPNTGPPKCALFRKISPVKTCATVTAKRNVSSSEPWVGRIMSSPSAYCTAPRRPNSIRPPRAIDSNGNVPPPIASTSVAKKAKQGITFGPSIGDMDDFSHVILMPAKKKKKFSCEYCDFTFRTRKVEKNTTYCTNWKMSSILYMGLRVTYLHLTLMTLCYPSPPPRNLVSLSPPRDLRSKGPTCLVLPLLLVPFIQTCSLGYSLQLHLQLSLIPQFSDVRFVREVAFRLERL
ncbi:hypothetical protein CEXT_785831 [Caerostris extrusa]|uniref:Zinc finger protein n=1 Tax=Caerostris extrusa TaxID=172846 RepID=A0AAV4TV20_CAEEX|nr:hypothetical protein CEXT_785831 [Caerostris extrusa]